MRTWLDNNMLVLLFPSREFHLVDIFFYTLNIKDCQLSEHGREDHDLCKQESANQKSFLSLPEQDCVQCEIP